MQPPSGPASRRHVPWNRLLLAGLLQRPSIQVSDPMVREKENRVVITCITNETDISVKWIFNRRQLKSAKNIFLSEDRKSLTIDPVKQENAGDYQCEIFNIGTSNRSETFELKVKKVKHSLFHLTTIAGIVIGTLVGLALIAALMYFCFSNKL